MEFLYKRFTFPEVRTASLTKKLCLSNLKVYAICRYQKTKEDRLNTKEIQRLQEYLRKIFVTDRISLKEGSGKDAPVEVSIGGEFIGVIYRNFDEGELSYDFNMAILEEDLP